MEALASGVPIVATSVGGIPEIVEHEKSGVLVRKGDIADLGSALTRLLIDYERCILMRQNAHAFARRALDGRKAARHLAARYRELMDEKKSDRSNFASA
jgi:glycosyltransferase involved in cell wall biosynthesis